MDDSTREPGNEILDTVKGSKGILTETLIMEILRWEKLTVKEYIPGLTVKSTTASGEKV